jgi:hypothetical protein
MKHEMELERVYDRHVGPVDGEAVAIGGYLSSWFMIPGRIPLYFKDELLSDK